MNKLIRKLSTRYGCIFLISFFIACQTPQNPPALSILWKENKAIGLVIPAKLVSYRNGDNISVGLETDHTSILGEIKAEGDHFLFTPLVPLTRGLLYRVSAGPDVIGEIEIPRSESAAPVLLAVYPTQDTVPENLLKIYLKFSQPMSEGRSLSHVTLLRNDRDTMKGTFLDLQPELWNTSGTVLTLWLDPGRIKRDLIPNKELGTPLHKGDTYTLHISAGWKSKDGLTMAAPLSKVFVTAIRDEKSPRPDRWVVVAPKADARDELQINFREPLDYSLSSEAIQIVDPLGEEISGDIRLGVEERVFHFVPDKAWKAGPYTINIESRLEDLAGNNLNRPFDRDLNVKGEGNESKTTFALKFLVR